MSDLVKQEQFEIEVLDKLNSKRFLECLVFGGGTMLRLCYGLNRFSVDLDFWITKDLCASSLFDKMREYLQEWYRIKDCAEKHFTLLFEIHSPQYPRNLKIEIRKEQKFNTFERAIAYSTFSNKQVLLNVVPLEDFMKNKIEALIERREIRDAFDVEFLIKKGVNITASQEKLKKMLKTINGFKKNDYAVKLCSLLDAKERMYYRKENFKILLMAVQEQLR